MAVRYRLHINQLDEYTRFLLSVGYDLFKPTNNYEVLRAGHYAHPGKILTVYRREQAKEHLSIWGLSLDEYEEWNDFKKGCFQND